MRSITRYILKQLALVTAAVTVGLTFAVWLTQSLRLIDYIVNRGLPATTFFSFVGLLLPGFLGIVLPIAAFCAVLFVYNKLTMDSELVVLRASGMSQLQLARPALVTGLVVTLLVYSITLYLLPLSFRNFKDLQHQIRNDYSAVLLQEGMFNTLSDEITVYVRERAPDGELRGILVHDNRNPEHPITMMAERGALVTSESGPRVLMVNGNRQEVQQETGRLSLLYFDSYTVEISKLQGGLDGRWREPKERFLPQLFRPDNSGDDQRYYSELVAEGHQRIVAPLYSLSFIMVALAALLSGEFNRRGQARRIIVAILCVALLEALALTLHDLANRRLEAVAAMYLGPLLPMLGSAYVLLRVPRRRGGGALLAQGAAGSVGGSASG
ncbi:MAG: LPS export ABC transporter permease LptF [Kiloniellales bacterium]